MPNQTVSDSSRETDAKPTEPEGLQAGQMKSSVTHFEIYAEDPVKLADFYRTVLGWQVDKAPGIDYWRIKTTPGQTNCIAGGLLLRPIAGPRAVP